MTADTWGHGVMRWHASTSLTLRRSGELDYVADLCEKTGGRAGAGNTAHRPNHSPINGGSRMAAKALPPQDVLRQLLDYDPETGALLWEERGIEWFSDDTQCSAAQRMALWNARYAGRPALNSSNGNGYLQGKINNQKVFAHRVAYKICTGKEPPQIDHINGDRSDNRLCNLRAVCNAENGKNQKVHANNSSGTSGVYWNKRLSKWHARIGGPPLTSEHLGYFETLEDAIAARRAAEVERGYHANHGRRR